MDAVYLLIGLAFFALACAWVNRGFQASKP